MFETAKYIIKEDDIKSTKKSSIEYTKNNYIIEDIKNEVSEDEMKEYRFQKIYFMKGPSIWKNPTLVFIIIPQVSGIIPHSFLELTPKLKE